jgi:hypothetical protein
LFFVENEASHVKLSTSIKKSSSEKTHQEKGYIICQQSPAAFSRTRLGIIKTNIEFEIWFHPRLRYFCIFAVWVSPPHQSGFWVWWVFRLKQTTGCGRKRVRVNSWRVINSKFRQIIVEKF